MQGLKLLFVVLSLAVMIIVLGLVMCAPAEASKSIGVGFSQSVDGEVSVGIQGEYETDAWDIEYQYQGIDFHDAKVDVAYRFNLGVIDVSIFQENDWAGYSLTNLNRTNDLGVSAIVPIKDVDIEFAVFGRNGNTAAPVERYDENTGELIETTPGLTPVDGTHPNISAAAAFDVAIFEVEGKFLTNFADDPTPQWLIDAQTTGKIWKLDWTLSGVYTGQRYQGEYQNEFASMLTFGFTY